MKKQVVIFICALAVFFGVGAPPAWSAPGGGVSVSADLTEKCLYIEGNWLCIKLPGSRGQQSYLSVRYEKNVGERRIIQFWVVKPGQTQWSGLHTQVVQPVQVAQWGTPEIVKAGCYNAKMFVSNVGWYYTGCLEK
ncbi:hypothetical protein [Amycolatopsis sp. cmx-11-12]|uniref:hypothetical protein n=1 Tax=Amycolatopsis sp. cmx-11-12 TaxID=2785795 RepID=UPI00391810AB